VEIVMKALFTMRPFLMIGLVFVLAAGAYGDGPFGSVPGQPLKPLPHYTPINPPRAKASAAKASDIVIYNSLKTAAKKGKKSVAGLTCTQSPPACRLAEKGSKEYDDYSIYVAITTKPKDVTSPFVVGSKTFQKQAGRLSCTETVTKAAATKKLKTPKPIASYLCKLSVN
jgi:hypothetical protein